LDEHRDGSFAAPANKARAEALKGEQIALLGRLDRDEVHSRSLRVPSLVSRSSA
jgi:hypothetical protein